MFLNRLSTTIEMLSFVFVVIIISGLLNNRARLRICFWLSHGWTLGILPMSDAISTKSSSSWQFSFVVLVSFPHFMASNSMISFCHRSGSSSSLISHHISSENKSTFAHMRLLKALAAWILVGRQFSRVCFKIKQGLSRFSRYLFGYFELYLP